MDRLEKIKESIQLLYSKGSFDWFFPLHVEAVVTFSKEIAQREKANEELCVLAALCHDLAYAWNIGDEPRLTQESLQKTEELMKEAGYSKEDIEEVKNIQLCHGCHDKLPETLEGKVLATADALAHLMTDFYLVVPTMIDRLREIKAFKKWAKEKIERDFHKKIFFEEDRKRARKRYEALKTLLE